MKKHRASLLSAIALLSLLAIGVVFTTGLLKNKPKREAVNEGVLGEMEEVKSTPTSNPLSVGVNQFVQDTIQDTKEVVSQKVVEVERKLVGTIEQEIKKEINNLTSSQIEALKLQICKDLGVITTTPTKQP